MIYRIVFLSFFAVTCLSCSKVNDEPAYAERTVLVYMAGDNNLYKNAKADIEEMLLADVPTNSHLLVYLDAPKWSADTYPQLYEIRQGQLILVKKYEYQNSASGKVLQQVINDARSTYPAKNYGLVLWSHGTGWLPEGAFDKLKRSSPSRSFGKDGTSEMNLHELAEAIPFKFEYIIFDACLMGGIEVLYQLRNKAKVIIASPTETLVAGFPYAKITPYLFTVTPNYTEIAQEYMRYYKNKTGVLQSATITVVDTKQLELLANTIKRVVEDRVLIMPASKESIQKYELGKHVVFYDLQDYITQVIQYEKDREEVKQRIASMVLYHDYTPYFLKELAIERSCGVSVYISSDEGLNVHYKQLDWYTDSKLLCSW